MISTETLRFFSIFAGQSNYMLQEIAMLSDKKIIVKGDWLFKQDDPAFWFYIILSGEMSLALVLDLNGSGEHVEKLGLLGRGEILGWSSLVNPFTYTLGAKAESETELIEINASDLSELFDDNPQFGYYFMKNLTDVVSERLRFKCIQLLSLKV